MDRSTAFLFTCEHGGNRVPKQYVSLFFGHRSRLDSHRGHDPGALKLARLLSKNLRAPLHFATVTRLLVELNRSIGHPSLFSDIVKHLSRPERDAILKRYYHPYRSAVQAAISQLLAGHRRVIHISVHTFTPLLEGQVRKTDIGLLYDPKRSGERLFCDKWRSTLCDITPEYTVHRNAPYRGVADGFTTSLRRTYPASRYWGIELEVNQRLTAGPAPVHKAVAQSILQSLQAVAEEFQ